MQRVDLLGRAVAQRRRHTLASAVAAMNKAATQDLRAVEVFPVLERVLRTGPASSTRADRMLNLLSIWSQNGGSRLDRDLDGRIDDPGAAILDAAWPRLAAAQGPEPAAWRADATGERIRFSGFLPTTMRWSNRPTFQQVISFRGHRPRK